MAGNYGLDDFVSLLTGRFGNNDHWVNDYSKWVNQAYRYLCTLDTVPELKKKIWIPELETDTTAATVAGQEYVTSPTGMLVPREIFDSTNSQRLDWFSWQDFIGRTDRATSAARSKPTKWHWRGGKIYLNPTPDAVYTLTVYYKKNVTELTGTDVTIIGAEWDDVILELAHYFGRMYSNEYDRAEKSMNAAVRMIAGVMDTYKSVEKARREVLAPHQNLLNANKGTF
jgi:hypothetical protein